MKWSFLILFIILFLFSVYIGFLIGNEVCVKKVVTKRDFWIANIAGIVIVLVVSLFLSFVPLLYAAAFGALAGCIAGLKMSFGESVGPWKVADKFFNINKGHRKVAEEGTGEERRRRRKAGEAGPDLISVDKNGQSTNSKGGN